MRALLESIIVETPFSPSSSSSSSNTTQKEVTKSYGATEWLSNCHGLFHNLALIVPSALFVVYLASQVKKSAPKLSNGRSHIIIAYYVFLWLVSLLNLAWCSLQAWECISEKEIAWNVLSLFTTCGMLFLEVSLMAFLLQGNFANGQEALTRTFLISGLLVGIDVFLKAIYLFGFNVPLFIDNTTGTQRAKWGLWGIHKLVLSGVYGFIFFLYRSKHRERLPARPAFYNYITIMFVLNALALFACALAANAVGFGIWLQNITDISYHALYLPLIYVTFLSDFLQEDDLHFENIYYAEMKDAGFFDDWD